jgi:hypothetical protein
MTLEEKFETLEKYFQEALYTGGSRKYTDNDAPGLALRCAREMGLFSMIPEAKIYKPTVHPPSVTPEKHPF